MTNTPQGENPRNPEEGSAAPGSSAENAAYLGSTSASGNAEPARQESGVPETSNPRPAPQGDSQKPDGDQFGRDETRRNPNIDPAPEGGAGDLQPGETPPESNSATASPPAPAPTRPPRGKAVITTVIIAIVLLLGLVFVGYAAGLLD